MDKPLFDDDGSDNEVTFKSSSEYAKKYNTLRRKEELLKLKNRLGSDAVISENSSSSEDEDDEIELTEGFERDFFKTLSYLKNKDPRIYDNNTRFFDDKDINLPSTSDSKKDKNKPLTIRHYNREAILETGGKFSDNEEDESQNNGRSSPTYVQEQKQIKTMLASALKDEENDEDADIGGMFVKKKKTKEEEDEEEMKYHEWLAGDSSNLNDKEEKELKALKDYWSNPKLDDGEAFLRDYFLNQRFKEHTNKEYIPSYDEIVNDAEYISEDEKLVGQQTAFEHKFNFRFEEPDQDFIKQYPRTLEHSMRQKDNKRARKRTEIKERKAEEKRKKKEEIAQLKSLKLKEIQEKIEKLKEITGNDQLAFKDEDIEGDFDPDEHDRRMRELFSDNYYGEEADAKKPEFPDLDQELEIDNWDEWNVKEEEEKRQTKKDVQPSCEDDNFNMDCDYDPTSSKNDDILENQTEAPEGRRRKRKRKNKLAEALAKKKPVFDPEKMDKTFAEYLDEYYKLDCEDVIGDMPCRFKYREVPACDYGLTTAEIFMADDQELNRWYPLKKTLQYRPKHEQRNDQHVYSNKAKNEQLKKKLLPSLFKKEEEEEVNENVDEPSTSGSKKRNKRKKKNKNKNKEENNKIEEKDDSSKDKKEERKKSDSVEQKVKTESNQLNGDSNEINNKKSINKKKKVKSDNLNEDENVIEEFEDNLVTEAKNNESTKKKKKRSCESEIIEEEAPPKKKKKQHSNESEIMNNKTVKQEFNKKKKNGKNKQHGTKDKEDNKSNPMQNISDERLKAYGLNPKKYRSFMKYKKY